MAAEWKCLIRFEDETGSVHWGEPTDANLQGATVWEGSTIFDLKKSDIEKKVIKLLSPYQPDNIICIGLNYRDHAKEANFPIPTYPIVFHKSKNTLTGPHSPVPIPNFCTSMDYENEFCVVIAKDAKNVAASDVFSSGYIAAYTIGNDVSARDWQKREVSGGQFSYAKSFDEFLPLGPALVHPEALGKDVSKLKIITTVNGEVCQDGSTEDMIFDVPRLLEFLTRGTTVPAGTLIMTGTPKGVAAFRKSPPVWLKAGDVVECEIEGLGKLKNRFVEA